MVFAAEAWRSLHKWLGPVGLAAIQVAGAAYDITGFTVEVSANGVRRAQTRQFG